MRGESLIPNTLFLFFKIFIFLLLFLCLCLCLSLLFFYRFSFAFFSEGECRKGTAVSWSMSSVSFLLVSLLFTWVIVPPLFSIPFPPAVVLSPTQQIFICFFLFSFLFIVVFCCLHLSPSSSASDRLHILTLTLFFSTFMLHASCSLSASAFTIHCVLPISLLASPGP